MLRIPAAKKHVAPNRARRRNHPDTSLGGLYVAEGPDEPPRPLTREELAHGTLRAGAQVLVTHACIEKAISKLLDARVA